MSDLQISKDLLTAISQQPRGRRTGFLNLLGKLEFDRCAEDIFYWLEALRHGGIPYVFTQDPHPMYYCNLCKDSSVYKFSDLHRHLALRHEMIVDDVGLRSNFSELSSVRPFTMFPYIRPIVETWLREPLVAWEKSRDMMATWTTVVMFTWDAFFHDGRQHIFQSDDSTKTAELVERAAFICNHQPSFLRQQRKIEYTLGQSKSGELLINGGVATGGSEILGFPQGPDQIRQYHPSGIFLDEAAFQIEASEAFSAIKPSIQNGGKCTMVSTANPGFFWYVARDRTDEIIEG